MHHKLMSQWKAVLAAKGASLAIIEAENGHHYSFEELEQASVHWLNAHPELAQSDGSIWGLGLTDRVKWMTVFLAAIKVGAVVLPLEGVEGQNFQAQCKAHGVRFAIDDEAVQWLPQGRQLSNCLLIKLTSGSTGTPKALPFSEDEMIADGAQIMRTMGFSGKDRNYAIIPLGHSYGLGNLVMPFFQEGVSMVLGSSPFPQVILEELRQFPCSVLALVPPLIKGLSMVTEEAELCPELRLVLSAGSALKPGIVRRFREQWGLPIHNFYGSSETGGIAYDRTGELAEVAGALGTAMEGVALGLGEDGSIQVESAAICHAAYPSGRCTLHDFGRFDEAGAVHLVGRHSDLIKIAGRRLSLSEVERALCGLEGVADAYVSSRSGRSGEARCVALYCGSVEVAHVREQLLKQLPSWKVPKFLRQVEAIPYNARGKKDRTALEQQVDVLM